MMIRALCIKLNLNSVLPETLSVHLKYLLYIFAETNHYRLCEFIGNKWHEWRMNSNHLHCFECWLKTPLHTFLHESNRNRAPALIQKPLWENYYFYENSWNQRTLKGLGDDLTNLPDSLYRWGDKGAKRLRLLPRVMKLVINSTRMKIHVLCLATCYLFFCFQRQWKNPANEFIFLNFLLFTSGIFISFFMVFMFLWEPSSVHSLWSFFPLIP